MRKLLLRYCVLLLLALSLAAQTDNWKKYDNKEGNFTVQFPGQPQDSVNKSDNTINSHTLLAKDQSAVYTVVYSTMATTQNVDNATYEIFKNAVFKELPQCQVEAEQAPVPALNGYIGHQYRLSCNMTNKVMVEGNLYWGKRSAYAVMVMFPASAGQPQTDKKFLESFAVLDATK